MRAMQDLERECDRAVWGHELVLEIKLAVATLDLRTTEARDQLRSLLARAAALIEHMAEREREVVSALKAALTPVEQAFEHYQAEQNNDSAVATWAIRCQIRAALQEKP